MNLCDSGHDEVCYEGKGCPFCFEIDTLEKQAKELMAQRDEAIDNLQALKSDFRAIAAEMREANRALDKIE